MKGVLVLVSRCEIISNQFSLWLSDLSSSQPLKLETTPIYILFSALEKEYFTDEQKQYLLCGTDQQLWYCTRQVFPPLVEIK